MPESPDAPPPLTGLRPDPAQPRITVIELVALALTILWLTGAGVFFLVLAPGNAAGTEAALRFVLVLMAVFLPVAMIWVAAVVARSSGLMRDEGTRLAAAVDALRHAYIAQARNAASGGEPTLAKKLEEIAAAQRKTETALATFSTTRQAPPKPTVVPAAHVGPDTENDQVALPLGTPVEDLQPPLERVDFIRALNFPDTPEDRAGFAALRRALKDRPTAQLVQAAQDVLTLLSQDGIYMDDLRPDMARPETWRRFAEGERGRAVAALGGIRDRSSLALTASRMKQDAIFRDAAHHFLRLFDRAFTQFAQTAADADISDFADTRSARAFMLLGRVAGTFD